MVLWSSNSGICLVTSNTVIDCVVYCKLKLHENSSYNTQIIVYIGNKVVYMDNFCIWNRSYKSVTFINIQICEL